MGGENTILQNKAHKVQHGDMYLKNSVLLGMTQKFITLVDLQLDAQNSYLFTYNTFIIILFMFRALRCSSSGGLRRNYINAASGIVTVCR
jgi:hypothetical protein